MSGFFRATEVAGQNLDAADSAIRTSLLIAPASGASLPLQPVPQPAAPVATDRLPADPRPARRGPTVVVVEPIAEQRADRLDAELNVAARLQLPLSAAQLSRALSAHQPKALLCKHSLDGFDESYLDVCRAHDVEVYVLAHSVYGLFKNARLRRFGGLPWLQLRRRNKWPEMLRTKRLMDVILTVFLLPLLLPLMVVILAAVCCSGRPLYFQERVGAGGRPFRMIKFRTMRVHAERDTGPTLSGTGDVRITRAGRILRRYRLDELPQLVNVLIGNMSLVGPRPERPEFVVELLELPDYELRHLIRPGMTGIAQLTGGYAATPEEKLCCDLLYLHSQSLRSDLKLLVLTAVELCRGFPRG